MSEPKFLLCACVHCANHIEFPGEMVGMVVDCPHCAQATLLTAPDAAALPIAATAAPEKPPAGKKSWKARLGPILGILSLLVFVAGGVFLLKQIKPRDDSAATLATAKKGEPPPSPREPELPPPPRKPGDDLQVLRLTIEKAAEGNLRYVAGVITNHADKQLFNVKVEFEMLNAKGQVVGTATDYLGNLGANTAWDYRAQIVDRDATKARLIKLVGEKD